MVVGSIRHEIESPVEAKRLWNAFVKDGHNLLPRQLPEIFSSISMLQGEGGVGTIKKINFTQACNKDFSYVKERVEELDEENFVYRSTHVEGGALGKKLASASYEFKYMPRPEGGCLSTCVFYYDSLPGAVQDEGKVEEIKCTGNALFRRIEAYLLANPTMYC